VATSEEFREPNRRITVDDEQYCKRSPCNWYIEFKGARLGYTRSSLRPDGPLRINGRRVFYNLHFDLSSTEWRVCGIRHRGRLVSSPIVDTDHPGQLL